MIDAFHYSCEGESHKAINKVGQDYSFSSIVDDLAVAIVCDGHGGDRYFRSDIGSRCAVEATLEAVTFFVEKVGDSLFERKKFTAVGPTSSLKDAEDLSEADSAFRQLFSSIIYKWNEKIKVHAKSEPLTEWEKANVPQQYLDEFLKSETFEKHYGCTLMTYVQTPKYWFAFHIGDGKCIFFQKDPIWTEPIPWDEKCFLNETTSLCDNSPIDEFRYCYEGDGKFPIAVLLGSDGIDDSFGETTNLVNFYIQILKMLAKEGVKATKSSVIETLPKLSKIGSKDDMSVACVFNLDQVKENINLFIRYQIDRANKELNDIEEKINHLKNRIDSLVSFSDEKSKIEFKYAVKDLERAFSAREKLAEKHNHLVEELPEGMVRPYFIEDEDYVIPTQEQPKSDEVVIEEEPKEPEKEVTTEAIPEEQNSHKESPKHQAKKLSPLESKKHRLKLQAQKKNHRKKRRR
jgi:serine/threonine protein phosphatase PrpC